MVGMTERKKLVELLDKIHHKHLGEEYYERLATTADYLLDEGIVVPPVNLGDTVYWHNGVGVITEYKIEAIQYTFSKGRYMWRLDLGDGLMPIYPHHALFLTREEAEKNVKEQKIAYYKDMKNRAEKDLEEAEKELAKEGE